MNSPLLSASDSAIEMLAPSGLAQLLDVDASAQWTEADALAALRHQLAAPLLPDLALTPGAELERMVPQAFAHENFLAALLAEVPQLVILQAIKDWARHVRTDSASPLAGGPATVLYYAAIAAARVGLKQSITTLSEAQLREGVMWAAAVPGAEPLAGLFAKTLPLLVL